MRLLIALAVVLSLACCASALPVCHEMTWPDWSGGQVPPERLKAEDALLWSALLSLDHPKTADPRAVATPCGDQLPCRDVAELAAQIGRVRRVERCAVVWLPPQESR
jgi:hypothetical protein